MDEPLAHMGPRPLLVAHMGPRPLPEGVVFSQALSDRVFAETGVRATYRSRLQWGSGKY